MKIRMVFVLFASVLMSLPSSATEARLITTGSIDWNTPAKWANGYVPMSAEDTASLTVEGQETKTIYMALPTASFALDAIVDCNPDTYMMFARAGTLNRLTIRQLSGYDSIWPIGFRQQNVWATSNYLRSGLNMTGTAEEPTEVNAYYLGCLPEFGVPDVMGCGWIHRLMNIGMFTKDGAGELKVDAPIGVASGAYLTDGILTISAENGTADPKPAAGAFLHVDASADETLEKVTENDRVCIDKWSDVNGNGRYAHFEPYAAHDVDLVRPRLAEKTVNGRALIDFGRYAQFSTGFDPAAPAAWLQWSESSTAICEAFYAVELQSEATIYNSSSAATPAPIGYGSSNINMTMKCDDLTVFTESDAHKADVRVNGEPMTAMGTFSPYSRMRIISVAFKGPIGRASAFGRRGSTAAGGFLLGEAIVYTNALTEVERRQTIAYLKRRWLDEKTMKGERADFDLGELAVRGGAISVPVGKETYVKRLHDVMGAGLVKTGDGTLGVESVQPADAAITVLGGKVRFTDLAGRVTVPTALPENPAFHFDATDDDSFAFASNNFVQAWRDVRPDSPLVATNMCWAEGVTGCPERKTAASPTGLKAVDFVTTGIGNSYKGAPRMAFAMTNVREGFIVWKNTFPSATTYAPTHFSCIGTVNGQDCFVQRAKGTLLHQTYSRYLPASGGAVWTVNGKPVNPFDSSFGDIGGDEEFVVIHFTSAYPLPINAMAAQGTGGVFGGGCMIGELVGYERLLTDSERRGAEAYLMDRWLGVAHPDSGTWKGDLTFGPNVPAEIATDRDLTPASITVPGTSLAKSGSGMLDVGKLSTNLTSVVAKDGTLVADVSAFNDFEDAFVHFDASDTNSFEWTSNGDGTYSITKWYDTRKNGIYAEADTAMCRALPQFRTAAETGLAADAVGYVDFGPISICGASPYPATNDLSSAMTWSVASKNVHEVHVVYADNVPFKDGGSSIPCPVTYYDGSRDWHHLSGIDRGYSQVFVYKNSTDGCCICDVNYNGEQKEMHGMKPDGFGVVSLVVTNSYVASDGTSHATGAYLNTFTNSRRTQYGGCRIAEVVVYDKALPEVRRKAVDAYLMKKWCGLGDGWTRSQGPAVSVAAGATTTLKNAEHVDLKSLAVGINAAGVSGALKVDGVFHAPESFALTVNLATSRRLGGKSFTVIAADSIADAENVAGWTVTVVGAQGLPYHLAADEDGNVVLTFEKKGFGIVIR